MKTINKPKHNLSGKTNFSGASIKAGKDKTIVYIALGVIVLISFIAYLPVIHNGFLTCWDDLSYVKSNPLIRSFNLKDIFSQNVMGNWHPFTMLVYTIEYHFFELNPAGYHAVNLFLHLVNVILVFYVVYLISDKATVALAASLLFGIHPLHVESVAWVSELKDLLYTMFFLASYIMYLKYLKELKKNYELRITNYEFGIWSHKYYLLALLLFLVSLFSKAMAASLPLVMILTDYFKGRKIDKKAMLEKAPFFLLAVIFGVVAIMAQKSSIAIQDIASYTFSQRLVFAAYGFVSYLVKLVLPLNLSAFYPYPANSPESIGSIPIMYYAYVLIFIALAAYIVYSVWPVRPGHSVRMNRSDGFTKKIIFGMGFFTITVLLVLQILPVGKTIMADRYSYIPSIGIFWLAGEGLMWLWNKRLKWAVIAMIGVAGVFYSVKTYARCGVWKNDELLWNDVITRYQTIAEAYYNRGIVYAIENRFDEAKKDFSKTIELNPKYAEAYNNRGNVFLHEGKINEAITDYNKAIELMPTFRDPYINRNLAFGEMKKKNDEELNHLNQTLEENSVDADAFYRRGELYLSQKRFDEAMKDFNRAIELKAGNAGAYLNRGILLAMKKRFDEAIRDVSKAIELKPDYALAWYNRAIFEFESGNKIAACTDLKKAAGLGYKQAEVALSRICK